MTVATDKLIAPIPSDRVVVIARDVYGHEYVLGTLPSWIRDRDLLAAVRALDIVARYDVDGAVLTRTKYTHKGSVAEPARKAVVLVHDVKGADRRRIGHEGDHVDPTGPTLPPLPQVETYEGFEIHTDAIRDPEAIRDGLVVSAIVCPHRGRIHDFSSVDQVRSRLAARRHIDRWLGRSHRSEV